jgi:hypothetical protein
VNALVRCLEDAGREVGRFRRRVYADPQLARFRFMADRLADNLERALLLLSPSAAELLSTTCPGDDQAADEAIACARRRGDQIRRLLGDEAKP